MNVADSQSAREPEPRWRRYTLWTLLLVMLVFCIVAAISTAIWRGLTDPLRYNKRFHSTIESADRIVVRRGGFDCCGPVDNQEVLFQITDADELAEVRERIQFVPAPPGAKFISCLCCGYPGIDWYKGRTRVALTSVKHFSGMMWKGFPGDYPLTDDSCVWMRQWLARHGVTRDDAGR